MTNSLKKVSTKQVIRVLHIFSPDLKTRFGGPSIRWKNYLLKWKSGNIVHSVLDYGSYQIVDAQQGMDFDYPDQQKMSSRLQRALWVFPLLYNLVRLRKEYDILHIHTLFWATLLIGPLAKMQGKTSIYESVLLGADTPTGVSKERFGKIKILLLKSFSSILCISAFLEIDYVKNGFKSNRIFTVVNSIPEGYFSPLESVEQQYSIRKKYGIHNDAKVLIFVGSLIKRKGIDVLFKAFIQACQSHPNLYLLLVGPSRKTENPSIDEDLIEELITLIKESDLSDRIQFTGLVEDRQELANLYKASDIFIFPSREEGLGNVVLEAMASGLPVIVSNIPVLENIAINDENSLIVPIGSVDKLHEAIIRLALDEDLRKRLGENGLSFAIENFNFTKWQASMVDIYTRIQGGREF
ncbi:glycosyltransferase family 4 protein [Chloroflexota bacterium]